MVEPSTSHQGVVASEHAWSCDRTVHTVTSIPAEMPSNRAGSRKTLSSSMSCAVGLICVALCTTIGQVTAAAPAATARATADSLGAISPEAEAMIGWMHKNGGQVNVVIRTLPDLRRKVFAPRAFKTGDVLAEIPLSCAFTMLPEDDEELWSAGGGQMHDEMNNPDSHYQPYFKTLPPRERVWSFYDIPATYMPLIQSPALEDTIASLQKEKLHAAGSSTESEGLRYALSLLETRAFGAHNGDGLQMLPVLDMADHTNECINYYNLGNCSSSGGDSSSSSNNSDDGDDSEYDCIIWHAGDDIAEGQEVCNNYRYLAQDTSLLQYGFLQTGPTAQLLSRIDRHDFITHDPWAEPAYDDYGVERFEPAAPEQAQAEITRLQQLLHDLKAKDAELKDSVEPHPRDAGGWYLQQLWVWREQRQAAIELEIARLSQVLKRLEAAFEVYDKPKPQAVYDDLLSWLKANGAQVDVEAKAVPPAAEGATSSLLHGVYTTSALKAGASLAVIPIELTYSVKGGAGHITDAALSILQDMHTLDIQSESSTKSAQDTADTTQAKFWAPYYATLPSLGSLKTGFNLPSEYAKFIQEPDVDAVITEAHTDLRTAWSAARADLDAATYQSLTRADLEHMAAVVSSRIVSAGSDGLLMVPLIDLARYNNSCPHTIHFDTCPSGGSSSSSGSSGRCMIWKAGQSLAAGEAVCTAHHGHLLPDVALLQYGMILSADASLQGDAAAAIFGMDDHRLEVHVLFGAPGTIHQRVPPFSGTREESLNEAASLTILRQQITSEEAEVDIAAVKAAADDWGGKLLQQLKQWRQLRIAALEKEIDRLMTEHGLSQHEVTAEVDRQVAEVASAADPAASDEYAETGTQEYEGDHSEL